MSPITRPQLIAQGRRDHLDETTLDGLTTRQAEHVVAETGKARNRRVKSAAVADQQAVEAEESGNSDVAEKQQNDRRRCFMIPAWVEKLGGLGSPLVAEILGFEFLGPQVSAPDSALQQWPGQFGQPSVVPQPPEQNSSSRTSRARHASRPKNKPRRRSS